MCERTDYLEAKIELNEVIPGNSRSATYRYCLRRLRGWDDVSANRACDLSGRNAVLEMIYRGWYAGLDNAPAAWAGHLWLDRTTDELIESVERPAGHVDRVNLRIKDVEAYHKQHRLLGGYIFLTDKDKEDWDRLLRLRAGKGRDPRT